ncbi:UNVERIFIED_CONTAM: hypothetical protein HDU68_004874 [Siphonaria sp. JEL0065]|nr:hypothetical protein HDU68_004874 [Siphonaria sp. JEL0065]
MQSALFSLLDQQQDNKFSGYPGSSSNGLRSFDQAHYGPTGFNPLNDNNISCGAAEHLLSGGGDLDWNDGDILGRAREFFHPSSQQYGPSGSSGFKPWLNALAAGSHQQQQQGWNGGNFDNFDNGINNGIGTRGNHSTGNFGNLQRLGGNIRRIHQIAESNIVHELAHDRQRDDIQANLIKHLIKKSSATHNAMSLVQAIASGQEVPLAVVAQLLTQDYIMDHIAQTLITRMLEESTINRNADKIIYDFATGGIHAPVDAGLQKDLERDNFLIDTLRTKCVQHVTAPHANKVIANPQHVLSILETLMEAQQRFPALVTPSGIQFGKASGNFGNRNGFNYNIPCNSDSSMNQYSNSASNRFGNVFGGVSGFVGGY